MENKSRIEKLFNTKNSNILSVYYPAGYPKIDDTMAVLSQLEKKGVDMVELGIPFSDPMADGAVIQAASTKALENGISLRKIFEQISAMRQTITIPVVLMGYLNPIEQFGFENFCKECQKCGVDGVIIPDLPYKEYIDAFKAVANQYKIDVIMFITPETSLERVKLIDENSSGFIYMVSSAATTGAQKSFAGAQEKYFEKINSMQLKNPRVIGFGVSNRETFNSACKNSSGAIIGSHFVKLLGQESAIETAVDKLLESIK